MGDSLSPREERSGQYGEHGDYPASPRGCRDRILAERPDVFLSDDDDSRREPLFPDGID